MDPVLVFVLAIQHWCLDACFLHGLWPQRGEYCESVAYVPVDGELRDDMMRYWSIPCESPEHTTDLWEHEWSKHGTCSGMNETSYFSKAMDLFQTHREPLCTSSTGQICLDGSFETVPCPAW